MATDEFQLNLMRLFCAELYFLLGMNAAREMYGKSYFALGLGEKAAVDQAVFGTVANTYQSLTPEFLRDQQAVPQQQQRSAGSRGETGQDSPIRQLCGCFCGYPGSRGSEGR